jgi:hypothetical protein
MNKGDYSDAFEAASEKFRRGFDKRLLEEYVLTFRDSRRDEQGGSVPEDRIWTEVADFLCMVGATRWRYAKGVDHTGNRPSSSFDGRPERYRPGIEEVFRYIAAVDITVESVRFPRGRIIVNRAVARALTGVRRIMTGEDHPITDVEVERLRFLERWHHRHKTKSGFSAETVRDMCNANGEQLMGQPELSDTFIRSLNRLFADWAPHHVRLLQFLPYDWVRG